MRMRVSYRDADDTEISMEMPGEYEVCPRCEGSGTMVDPAIDGDGIPGHEFEEDPDFREAYFGGAYDVPCNVCHGQRVVMEPRPETPEEIAFMEERRVALEAELRVTAQIEAEMAAERRFGC